MLVPAETKAPYLINRYYPGGKSIGWRQLTNKQEISIRNTRLATAAIMALVWAAAGVGFYFLATTSSTYNSNAIFIPPIAVPLVFCSAVIFGVRLADKDPREILKFEQPGVSEQITFYLGQDIGTLRPFLEQNGEVAPLVQNGFLLPEQGEALVNCIDAFDSNTATEEIAKKWKDCQGEIATRYRQPYTLEQIYTEKYSIEQGFEKTFKMQLSYDMRKPFHSLMKRYIDCKKIIAGFEQCTTEFQKQNENQPRYQDAIARLGFLEDQWKTLHATLKQ